MTATVVEVTDEEIARYLTSPEVSNLSVVKRLGVPWGRVDEVRQQLGLTTYRRGRRSPEKTWEEAVRKRVRPMPDGHAEWQGTFHPNGTPMLSWQGQGETAYRAVFRLNRGRAPEGNITHTPDCPVEHCVAWRHLEDRLLRDRRRGAGGAR